MRIHTEADRTRPRAFLPAAALAIGCGMAAGGLSAQEGVVHLRGEVVDAQSREPLPARVYIQGKDGTWHFPSSAAKEGSAVAYRKERAGVPEMHVTLSAHPFAVDLPPGAYTITVERGKEYHPSTQTVILESGARNLTVPLRRWIDMAARGWYSGDTHVHRPIDELPNLMLAEDVNVAFPIRHWSVHAYQAPALSKHVKPGGDGGATAVAVDPTHAIWPVNTEYEIVRVKDREHVLGAVFVLRHRAPFDIGVPPVRPVAERARREGALLELDKHNWPWSMMLVPVMKIDLFELSNNHMWRAGHRFTDFGVPAPSYMRIEMDAKGWTEHGWIDYGLKNYYALLDCGFRLRPTAGNASGVHPVPLGHGRVYVHLPDGFDPEAWVRGLDAGRSFVTTGPMLFVEVDGRKPGHVFAQETGDAREVRVTGSSVGGEKLDRIEIVVNGEAARTVVPANRETGAGAFESPIDERVRIEGSSWIAVRCFEKRPDGRPRFAHTAPVYFDAPGKPLRPRREEAAFLAARVEEEIARHAGVLPEEALEEYRDALRAYREVEKTAR